MQQQEQHSTRRWAVVLVMVILFGARAWGISAHYEVPVMPGTMPDMSGELGPHIDPADDMDFLNETSVTRMGNTVVVCFNDKDVYTYLNYPRCTTSTDGGEHFTSSSNFHDIGAANGVPMAVAADPTDPAKIQSSDPWVFVGLDGRVYASAVLFNAEELSMVGCQATARMVVTSSPDGVTWDSPLLPVGGTAEGFQDFPKCAADDNVPGGLFCSWNTFTTSMCANSALESGRTHVAYSPDGGATWHPSTGFGPNAFAPGSLAVWNGLVTVPVMRDDHIDIYECNATACVDAGHTITPAHPVPDDQYSYPGQVAAFRVGSAPVIAAQKTGLLLAAWLDFDAPNENGQIRTAAGIVGSLWFAPRIAYTGSVRQAFPSVGWVGARPILCLDALDSGVTWQRRCARGHLQSNGDVTWPAPNGWVSITGPIDSRVFRGDYFGMDCNDGDCITAPVITRPNPYPSTGPGALLAFVDVDWFGGGCMIGAPDRSTRGGVALLALPALLILLAGRRAGITLMVLALLTMAAGAFAQPTPTATPTALIGDCNGDGCVRINEVILAVGIALIRASPEACPAAYGRHCGGPPGIPPIPCLIQAVENLFACKGQ